MLAQHGERTKQELPARYKLEPLSRAAFDKAFVAYMVDDHEKHVADFKKEASSSRGDVQTLASESLPTLEKHLGMATSLAGKF